MSFYNTKLIDYLHFENHIFQDDKQHQAVLRDAALKRSQEREAAKEEEKQKKKREQQKYALTQQMKVSAGIINNLNLHISASVRIHGCIV